MLSFRSESLLVITFVGVLSSIAMVTGSPFNAMSKRVDDTVANFPFDAMLKRDDHKASRDPAFPACDVDKDSNTLNEFNVGPAWYQTDDTNYYLTAGLGSCGKNYTDTENVVCLHPGWVQSGNVNHCNAWVQIYLNTTGVVATARVADTCGAVVNSTFGCNDMFTSKGLFRELAGAQPDEAVDAGNLPGLVQWRFISQPCWSCAGGLPGILPNGTADTCKGEDQKGFLRCGRKDAAHRLIGPATSLVCNSHLKTCDEVNKAFESASKCNGTTTHK